MPVGVNKGKVNKSLEAKKTAAGRAAVIKFGAERGVRMGLAAEERRKNNSAANYGRLVNQAKMIDKKRSVANSAVVNKPKKESSTARKRIVK